MPLGDTADASAARSVRITAPIHADRTALHLSGAIGHIFDTIWSIMFLLDIKYIQNNWFIEIRCAGDAKYWFYIIKRS